MSVLKRLFARIRRRFKPFTAPPARPPARSSVKSTGARRRGSNGPPPGSAPAPRPTVARARQQPRQTALPRRSHRAPVGRRLCRLALVRKSPAAHRNGIHRNSPGDSPVTTASPPGKPNPVLVTFSGSAAPLAQTGKDLDPKFGRRPDGARREGHLALGQRPVVALPAGRGLADRHPFQCQPWQSTASSPRMSISKDYGFTFDSPAFRGEARRHRISPGSGGGHRQEGRRHGDFHAPGRSGALREARVAQIVRAGHRHDGKGARQNPPLPSSTTSCISTHTSIPASSRSRRRRGASQSGSSPGCAPLAAATRRSQHWKPM